MDALSADNSGVIEEEKGKHLKSSDTSPGVGANSWRVCERPFFGLLVKVPAAFCPAGQAAVRKSLFLL